MEVLSLQCVHIVLILVIQAYDFEVEVSWVRSTNFYYLAALNFMLVVEERDLVGHYRVAELMVKLVLKRLKYLLLAHQAYFEAIFLLADEKLCRLRESCSDCIVVLQQLEFYFDSVFFEAYVWSLSKNVEYRRIVYHFFVDRTDLISVHDLHLGNIKHQQTLVLPNIRLRLVLHLLVVDRNKVYFDIKIEQPLEICLDHLEKFDSSISYVVIYLLISLLFHWETTFEDNELSVFIDERFAFF